MQKEMAHSDLFVILFVLVTAPAIRAGFCSYKKTCYMTGYRTCGWWGLDRCSRTESYSCYYQSCCNGWTGDACNNPVCSSSCLNGGICVRPETCSCPPAYNGDRCQTPVCSPACSNEGSCVRPGSCSCPPAYTGDRCQTLRTTTTSTTTTPQPFTTGNNNCTFDQGTLCGWSQMQNDDFDWIIVSGPTLGMGPRDDHTMETAEGKYLYIESESRSIGDNAMLASSAMPAGQSACFEFWNYMYGEGTGNLHVYLQDEVYRNTTEIFRKSGSHGNQWSKDKVTVHSKDVPREYRLLIKGVVGQGDKGDISIDDLSTITGQCTEEDFPSVFG